MQVILCSISQDHALWTACFRGKKARAQELLMAGADIAYKNEDNVSLL